MTFKPFFSALKSALLKVFVFWILLFATYLALGRQFFPLINKYQPEIEQWLSSQFQADVSIGSIDGRWARFGPIVTLNDIDLGGSLTIRELVLAPGIFESISHGGLSFLQFELTQFNGHLFQNESGDWQLNGLKPNPGESRTAFDIDKLLALLQRQQNIQFSGFTLKVEPQELPTFELVLNQGQLSGYDGLNSLVADAALNYLGLSVPIELQVETNQQQPTLNKLYLKHGSFDFSPWLSKLTDRIEVASGAGEYWLNFNSAQLDSLSSRIEMNSLVLSGKADKVELSSVSAELFVELGGDSVNTQAQLKQYNLNGASYAPANLIFNKKQNELDLSWDLLPASIIGAWFSLDDTSGFWPRLNIQGNLNDGSALVELGENNSISLASNFNNGRIDPAAGVPGLNNLTGRLSVNNRQGAIDFYPSITAVSLPFVYDKPLTVDIESSSLRWDVVEGVGLLMNGQHTANILADPAFEAEPLPATAKWFVSRKNDQAKKSGYRDELSFFIDSDQLHEDWIRFITKSELIPDSAGEFVESNLIEATAKQVEFSYISIGSQDSRQDQFDLSADVSQATMTFLDDWDAVTQARGHLAVTEKELTLNLEQAAYQSLDVDRGELSIALGTGQLDVDFSGQADADPILELFQTGPLNSVVGTTIDDWRVDGRIKSDVHINLNLDNPTDLEVTTLSDIVDGTLFVDNLNLRFDQLNGLLQFNSDQGFLAEYIELEHNGLLQQVSVDSELNEAGLLVSIHAQGNASLAHWGEYFNDRYLASFDEIIEHKTEINISSNQVQIDVETDFYGVDLKLPSPLNKLPEQRKPTRITVLIDQNNDKVIHLVCDDTVAGYIELDDLNSIERGVFSVNQPLEIREEAGIYIDVNTELLDGDLWWQTIQTIRELYSVDKTVSNSPSVESLIKAVNLNLGSVNYLGRTWTNASTQLLRNSNAWIVNFYTEEGRGSVLIPHSNNPVFANIDWLNISTESSIVPLAEQVDPLADILPGDIPAMVMQIKQLVLNSQDLGSWRANITTDADTLKVASIVGSMPNIDVTGDLEWQVDDGEHVTKFNGVINTGDILSVLNDWHYAPVLTSRDGSFNLDFRWLGSPAFFDFKRVEGKINLNLTKGAILKVEEYEGIKLIGLLNFTRVLQRIALDFSDLLSSGISFDTIEGELLFDRGFARVGEQLLIDGASTNFQFSGDADLLSNVIDIDMVLTVPLSSTFPLVALLAGVSPQAAAAIYVTERVFNNELKRLSSARMHITGSFEEPTIKFYRVFDAQLGADNETVEDRLKNIVPGNTNP